MATGYCPALLRQVTEVANGNSAVGKIHVAGFLKMLFCCQNSTVNPINDGYQDNSHRKTLTVAYRQRPTLAHVQEQMIAILTGFRRRLNGHFQTFITSKQLFICQMLRFRSIAMRLLVQLWLDFRLLL